MVGDRLSLPPDPSSVTVARHFLRDRLLGLGLDELVDDAQLAVCELVANAVRHTDGGFDLLVRVDTELLVEVHDHDRTTELTASAAAHDSTSGRGLQIVAAVCSEWGVRPGAEGKVVWFTLPLPERGRRDADLFDMDARRDNGDHEVAPEGRSGDARARVAN